MTDSRALIAVAPFSAGQRLDRFLQAAIATLSRNQVKRLLDQGQVRVQGRLERMAGRLMRTGELIEVNGLPPSIEPPARLTSDRIRYVDAHLLAVDKPAGLAMHAVEPGDSHHLVAAIRAWCAETGQALEAGGPFISSRLDKETSGLVVTGLTRQAGRTLTGQFAGRGVVKQYRAIVHGHPAEEGEIDAPIDALGSGRFGVKISGKPARTRYRVARWGIDEAELEVIPETGRSHQIRVHLASIGHPLVGDLLYGGLRREGVSRCLLHAECLGLEHPVTGERLELSAPPPEDMRLRA